MQDRIFDGLAHIQGWSAHYVEGPWVARFTDPGSGAICEIAVSVNGPLFLRTDVVGIATWPDFWAGIDVIREVMRGGAQEGSVRVPADEEVPQGAAVYGQPARKSEPRARLGAG